MKTANLNRYLDVATSIPGALEVVERTIEEYVEDETFSLAQLLAKVPAAVFRDHLRGALDALIVVGALQEIRRDVFKVTRTAAEDARARETARLCVQWSHAQSAIDRPALLVASPAIGLEQLEGLPFERYFADLRTSVRGLIATARTNLLLASPYWDADVANDLSPLIRHRLLAGVSVAILARAPMRESASEGALRAFARVQADGRKCTIRVLEERSSRDPFGAATFHFKLAAADSARVYLGSANFNTAGMASRWELGVLLTGGNAATLSDLVSALFRRAHDVSLA